jgi:hypothetical protein
MIYFDIYGGYLILKLIGQMYNLCGFFVFIHINYGDYFNLKYVE